MSRPRTTLIAIALLCLAAPGFAQRQDLQSGQNGRFITGPLNWTPTLQLREAGYDSNVFNTAGSSESDMTGSFGPHIDSLLKLPYLQLAGQGGVEYVYFDKYKSERALNRTAGGRILVPFTRFQPTASASWTRAKDRTSSELDLRAPRHDYGVGGGFLMKLGTRTSVDADLQRSVTQYDRNQLFRGIDIATRLNHHSTFLTTGMRTILTPFTTMGVDAGIGHDDFDLKPSLNTRNYRAALTFDFAPDAVIRGHAAVGYHRMDPVSPNAEPDGAQPFSGFTSSIDLGYTLLGGTRLNPKLARDVSYSVSGTSPIFVSTAASLEVLQELVGPLDLVVHGSREKMAFPETPLAEQARTDYVEMYGGGLSVRLPNQGRIMFNYDNMRRRSSAGAIFGYERRHLYTSVTYGF